MNSIILVVVLLVDDQDGQDDQVGEDEADHPTKEANPPFQHRSQRDVPDGADEGTIEMMGQDPDPRFLASDGCPVKKRCCQRLSGTQAARAYDE